MPSQDMQDEGSVSESGVREIADGSDKSPTNVSVVEVQGKLYCRPSLLWCHLPCACIHGSWQP